jgi:hypothetical protein
VRTKTQQGPHLAGVFGFLGRPAAQILQNQREGDIRYVVASLLALRTPTIAGQLIKELE